MISSPPRPRSRRRLAIAVGAVTAVALATATLGGPAVAKDRHRGASDVMPPLTTSFTGTNTGALADATGACGTGATPGAARVVSFAVSGVTGPLSNVAVAVDLTHTWAADLAITLTAPDGTTTSPVSIRPGATTPNGCGDSTNLGGLYEFNDTSTGNYWTALAALADAAVLPAGSFRGTGPLSATAIAITTPFAALTSAGINGTWTLTINDNGGGDTGSINAATLKLTGVDPVPCQVATAKVTEKQAALTAAQATLAADQAALAKAEKKLKKAKAKLKKLKQDGASDEQIKKAKAKVKKAKKAKKAAQAKVASSQAAVSSAQAALAAAQAEKAAVC